MINKLKLYDNIKYDVINCKLCKLCEVRSNAVPGQGSIDAKIIFVGEAPGRNEDKAGLPFVGYAGKILEEALKKAGFQRKDVYITNVAKCRPPNNRIPEPEEISKCIGVFKERNTNDFTFYCLYIRGNCLTISFESKRFTKISWKNNYL